MKLEIATTKVCSLRLSKAAIRIVKRGQRERDRLNDELASEASRWLVRYLSAK